MIAADYDLPPFAPEKLDAYEVGLKSELFDRRVRFNAAAFLYKFKNIQLNKQVAVGVTQVTNAGAATIKGIDFDFEAKASENFTVFGSLGLLDGEYTDYQNATAYDARPPGSAAGGAATAAWLHPRMLVSPAPEEGFAVAA